MDVGAESPQFVEIPARAKQEHAAVPRVATFGHVPLRNHLRRFLRERRDLGDAGIRARFPSANVAVARLRVRRDRAEDHEPAILRERYGATDRSPERVLVADMGIGGQHQEERIGAVAHPTQRRQSNRRGRTAPRWFEHDGRRLDPRQAALLRDDEPMLLVGDDHRRLVRKPVEARERVLQHGPVADQFQELLRIEFPRQRP